MKQDLSGLLSKKYEEILIDETGSLTILERGGDLIKFSVPVRVEGKLSRLEDGVIRFAGKLETVADTVCARCLEPINEKIVIEYDEVVFAAGKEEAYDLIALSDDCEFELEVFLRNLMELKLPMKFLCDEDCKGLCPICGTNLNTSECNCKDNQIDERLAKLKDLL